MRHTSPEAQEPLTAMIDKWVGILGVMGIKSPYDKDAPKSVLLQAETGETIVLDSPSRILSHPDPTPRQDLGYTNSITAHKEIDGVPHTLHVNSSSTPYVLAAEGGKIVTPRTSAHALLDLCLRGETIRA